MARRRIPHIVHNHLTPLDADGMALDSIPLDSADWSAWLADERNRSFSLRADHGTVTFRHERQRNGRYWYAYRWHGGKLHKTYAGRASDLTRARLKQIAARAFGLIEDERDPATPRLLLLGPPHLMLDQAAVPPLPAKATALLGYLAVHPRSTRDHILALLWPESSEAAARKNLRNLLWAIRAALGGDLLEANGRLSLRAEVWIDVREFSRHAADPSASLAAQSAALDLYRGSFLDGLVVHDASEFELWLMTERERLAQDYLRLSQQLADTHRTAASWRAIIGVARRAIAVDPLSEAQHRALIEAHARLGERADALRQYDTLRALLDRELGVAPLPETEALQIAIRDGTLAPLDVIPVRPRLATRKPVLVNRPPAPFIGRRPELAALDAALDAAASGRAHVVALTGELGIGKSQLWQEWSATHTADLAVIEGRCLRTTQTMPFAPLRHLLQTPAVMEQLAPAVHAVLSKGQSQRLRRPAHAVVPAIPTGLPVEEGRRQVFEALAAALVPLPVTPLILFLDDVHWADQATLDWLSYLLHRMADRPLLLVVTYRPEEASAALISLLVEWEQAGIARRLVLPRLAPHESAALLAALGGDIERAAELHQQSAGNPYYLVELARAAPGAIPSVLADLVRARIDRLSEGARQILQAAVVLEPEIDFATLRRTSGRDEDETLDALDALLGSGLLIEHGRGYLFGHPFTAGVVRASMSSARHAVLHRRAAEACESLHAEGLAPVAGQIMTHYLAAGDIPRAARYAEMAGDHALGLVAITEAVGFYRRALEIAPTTARQIRLAQVLSLCDEYSSAQLLFESALRDAEARGDRLRAAQACLGLAQNSLVSSRGVEIVEWASRGLALLADMPHPAERADAHRLLGAGLRQTEHSLEEAEAHFREAIRLAREHNLNDLLATVRFELGNLQADRGDSAGALATFQAVAAQPHATGAFWREALGHNNAAYHALLLGDLATAHRAIDAALRTATEHSLERVPQWLYSTRGEIALAEGRWDEAEEWFRNGLAQAEQSANQELRAGYHTNLALVARGRGEPEHALRWLEAARALAAPLAAPYRQTQIELWLAECYAACGDLQAAYQALAHAESRLVDSNYARLHALAEQVRKTLA